MMIKDRWEIQGTQKMSEWVQGVKTTQEQHCNVPKQLHLKQNKYIAIL